MLLVFTYFGKIYHLQILSNKGILSSLTPAIEKRIENVNNNFWVTTLLSIYRRRISGNILRSLLTYIGTEVAGFVRHQVRIIHEEVNINYGSVEMDKNKTLRHCQGSIMSSGPDSPAVLSCLVFSLKEPFSSSWS